MSSWDLCSEVLVPLADALEKFSASTPYADGKYTRSPDAIYGDLHYIYVSLRIEQARRLLEFSKSPEFATVFKKTAWRPLRRLKRWVDYCNRGAWKDAEKMHQAFLAVQDDAWRTEDYLRQLVWMIRPKAEPETQPAENGAIDANEVSRLLHLAGDGTGVHVLAVARDTAKSVEERLHKLIELDQRYDGFDSEKLADLLGVTGPAIRKTDFWRGRKDRREHL